MLTQLLGTMQELSSEKIRDYFKGLIIEHVKGAISRISKEQNISPMELESVTIDVANAVKGIIGNTLSNYGISLDQFNIEAIPLIDDDPRVQKVIEDFRQIMGNDLEERLRLKRHQENLDIYKLERSFDTTQAAAEHIGGDGGGAGGVLGTMVGMGMATPIARTMSNMMQANMGGLDTGNQPATQPGNIVKCSKCAASYADSSKFCPNCGAPYNPCAQCKTDNPEGQVNCINCGAAMPAPCSKCGTINDANAKFCNNCGNNLQLLCAKCNVPYKAGTRFCSQCGNNLLEANQVQG